MSDAPQSKDGGARVRFPPPLIVLGFIGLGLLLDWLVWPLGVPLAMAPRIVAGAILIIAGLALGAWSIVLFRQSGQDPAPWKPSPQLVLRGPYRFTRNPMYLGMTMVQLGVGVCAGNVWILLFAPLSLLLVHLSAVLPEEAYLTDRFGEDYRRYRARVHRYL